MTQRIYLWALLLWVAFLVMAVALGAVREAWLAPSLGAHAAHVIGTLAFVLALLVIIAVFVRRQLGQPLRRFWVIGVMWTVMTVAFEFGFFHFVAGKPWRVLLADYNIFNGRLWVLVLLTTLLAPAAMRRFFQ